MKDKNLLNIISVAAVTASLFFLFRKREGLKDWFLIYLGKTLLSTLVDGPVIRRNYLRYPVRYLPKLFDSNIVFLYILFPLSCVVYNQLTYGMKPLKTIFSAILFSGPMTIMENWLEKNTNLVEYGKGWNGLYTFTVLTISFWTIRIFIEFIRFIDKIGHGTSKNIETK